MCIDLNPDILGSSATFDALHCPDWRPQAHIFKALTCLLKNQHIIHDSLTDILIQKETSQVKTLK